MPSLIVIVPMATPPNDSGANLSIGRLHQVDLQTNLGRMADLVSRNIY